MSNSAICAKQVLPFLLRRNKEDVLQDLPPKITQDYYCDLSPLQRTLYEDFRTRHSATLLSTSCTSSSTDTQGGHVFEALRYLRNVCNHPKLVLNPRHPLYQTVGTQMIFTLKLFIHDTSSLMSILLLPGMQHDKTAKEYISRNRARS